MLPSSPKAKTAVKNCSGHERFFPADRGFLQGNSGTVPATVPDCHCSKQNLVKSAFSEFIRVPWNTSLDRNATDSKDTD